ncbi:MAG: hypothetical protein ABII90_01215 [Bacteroidota bacterium]
MEQLVVNIDKLSNAKLLISLLKELNFVKSASRIRNKAITKKLPLCKFKSKEEFWETFGTGKNTNIDIKYIKENAWRKIRQ